MNAISPVLGSARCSMARKAVWELGIWQATDRATILLFTSSPFFSLVSSSSIHPFAHSFSI
jgi:hypothetical protein